jgi:hypothetical protein
MKKYCISIFISAVVHLLVIYHSYGEKNNFKQAHSIVLKARLHPTAGLSSVPKSPAHPAFGGPDSWNATESIRIPSIQEGVQAMVRSNVDTVKEIVVPLALGPVDNPSDFSVQPPQINNPDDKPVGPFGGDASGNAFKTIPRENKNSMEDINKRRYAEKMLQVDQRIYILKSFIVIRNSELLAKERPTSCRIRFDSHAQFAKVECIPIAAVAQEIGYFVGETKFVSSAHDYPYCLRWGYENSELKC